MDGHSIETTAPIENRNAIRGERMIHLIIGTSENNEMNLAGMWATFVTTIRSSFRVRVHGNYSRVSDIRFFRNQARIGVEFEF